MNTLWKIVILVIAFAVVYNAATFWIEQVSNEVQAASFDEDVLSEHTDEWLPESSPWHNEANC